MGIKVGDMLKVRTYDSMANEYGVRSNGAIRAGFVPQMNRLLGRYGEVVSVDIPDRIFQLKFDETRDEIYYRFPVCSIVPKKGGD